MDSRTHLSDEQLLRNIDGEVSSAEAKTVRSHLEACWACRARKLALEGAISDFVDAHGQEFQTSETPSPDGPRALLKAQMALLAATNSGVRGLTLRTRWLLAGAAFVMLTFLVANGIPWPNPLRHRKVVVFSPDARLTPGATVLIGTQQLCSQPSANNKDVAEPVKRKVFQEYGLSGVESGKYEVDYLITPALGGADDIRNLWPHSYGETVWNAQVKDALESRLREMVCDGRVELSTAQREIATNWIATYKQYFHTDKPLGY